VLYPARRSPFIGLGLYGAPVFIMLVSLAAPLSLSYLPWRGLRFALVLCRYKIDATPLEKRGKGLEFRWEAPALRFAPSRCSKLSPLCGCVCVHQNMIPDDLGIPLGQSWPYRGGALLNFAITEFSEVRYYLQAIRRRLLAEAQVQPDNQHQRHPCYKEPQWNLSS
jgi:hypothetical protein